MMNICQLGAIESRTEHGTATNQDCFDLLSHFKDSVQPDFSDIIIDTIREATEDYLRDNIDLSSDILSNQIEQAIKGITK